MATVDLTKRKMTTTDRQIRVALASQSQLKQQVVEMVLAAFGQDFKSRFHLTCVAVEDPNQIEQPINEGGLKMVRNRIQWVLKTHPYQFDAIIVMENFIEAEHPNSPSFIYANPPTDYGWVMIYLPHEGTEFYGRTRGVELPDLDLWLKLVNDPQYHLSATQTPTQTQAQAQLPIGFNKTYGKLYHEAHPDIPANNWMKSIDEKYNRCQLLSEALEQQIVKIRNVQKFVGRLNDSFRHYPDFPIPGVGFLDWFGIFQNPQLTDNLINHLAAKYLDRTRYPQPIKYVAGLESRGYLLALPLAMKLEAGFVPMRKPGKIPPPKITKDYVKEYGTDSLELKSDLKPGTMLIADDILATGGSMLAAIQLAEEAGHQVIDCIVVRDVPPLREQARNHLKGYPIRVIIQEPHLVPSLALSETDLDANSDAEKANSSDIEYEYVYEYEYVSSSDSEPTSEEPAPSVSDQSQSPSDSDKTEAPQLSSVFADERLCKAIEQSEQRAQLLDKDLDSK